MRCLMNGLEVNYPCSPACALFGDCVAAFESHKKANVRTNADRVRAMSNEELSQLPKEWTGYSCVFPGRECGEEDSCEKCLLKWLQQPAEE